MRTLLLSLIAFVTLIPVAAFAQQNLVNLPIGDTGDFNDYINAVYLMFISIAALIAVVKIIIAGVKYMFSDIVTQKSDAKNDIKGALLGLLVILSAVVVLTIINPDLATFDPEISQIDRAELQQNQGGSSTEDATAIENYCNSVDGECIVRTCNALGDYSWELAAVAATGGAIAGGIAGQAVPIVGGVVLGSIGGVAGGVGGAVAAYKTQLALNNGECALVCSWYSGQMVDGGCLMATDASAFREVELSAIRARIAEENGCESGVGFYLGDEYNCRDLISEAEGNQIIDNFGIEISDQLSDSIINRIQEAQFQDRLITNQNRIDEVAGDIVASKLLILVEIPGNVSDPEYQNSIRVVEGICGDISAEHPNLGIGTVNTNDQNPNYVTCAQP
jgi:hypothetical protein